MLNKIAEHSGAKGLANCTFANCLLNSVGTFNPYVFL